MKRFCILIFSVIIAFACFATGCAYSKVKKLMDIYTLNLDASSDCISEAFESGYISFKGGSAYLGLEYKDGYLYEQPLKSGEYDVTYYYCYDDYVSGHLKGVISPSGISFNASDDCIYFKDVHVIISGKSQHGDMYFTKNGFVPDDFEETPPDNPPYTPPDNPSESKFNEIKAAYSSAGYNTELEKDESIDASYRQLISSLTTAYGQLGYNFCFIGKNMNDIFNVEMYMLVSTPDAAATDEIAREFETAGMNKYKKKDTDIIIYIWTLGTPNFTPFDSAVN